MANAAPKKRPMRSKRSGVKKFKQYVANWEILKKLGAFVLILFIASCTPVQYMYVSPQDSVVRKQRVVYDDIYLHTPLFFRIYSPYSFVPTYRVIIPTRPAYRPSPRSRH